MPRGLRSPLAPGLLAAAVGSAVAAQRDTPLRRWLLPPPDPAAAKFRADLPDLRLNGLTVARALAEVGRQAGVEVTVDPTAADVVNDPAAVVDFDLAHVTAPEAAAAVLRRTDRWLTVGVQGGRVVVTADDVPKQGEVVRAYDVSDLLGRVAMPDRPFAASGRPFGFGADRRAAAPARTDDEVGRRTQGLIEEVWGIMPASLGADGGSSGCRAFLIGGRLVVVATPPSQERVTAALRVIRAGHVEREPTPTP